MSNLNETVPENSGSAEGEPERGRQPITPDLDRQTAAPDPRGQAIDRCLEVGLHEPNPLLANVILANCDIMHLQLRFRKAVDAALGDTEASLADLEGVQPTIDLMVKNAKQIERFTRLELEILKADRR